MNLEKILEKKNEMQEGESMKANNEIKELTTGKASRYLEQKEQEQTAKNVENVTITETAESEQLESLDKESAVDTEQIDLQEDEIAAIGESDLSDEIEEPDAELQEQEAPTLPAIAPDDKQVILCEKEDYRLMMLPIYNNATLVMEKCKLFLVNANTNIPYIGAEEELQIAKEKIMTATDHTVFNIIKRYTVNFTEDDIKLAFARAKIFLETSTKMLAVNSSLNIIDAYRVVVSKGRQKAKAEENAMDSKGSEGRLYIYDAQEKIVKIRDKCMKEILEDTGFNRASFCRKIQITEVSTGYTILRHQKGRNGFNETGNLRYYELYLIDELMEEKVAQ